MPKAPSKNQIETLLKQYQANNYIKAEEYALSLIKKFPNHDFAWKILSIVLKKSGKKVPFDRDKLERSVQIALRKRPVDNERVDRMISGIVRRVESLGETEVSSDVIGEIVMEGLQSIDSVAYVRFASVYKNFREAKDFEEFLGIISSTED